MGPKNIDGGFKNFVPPISELSAGARLKVDPAACNRPLAAQDEERVRSIQRVVDFDAPPRSKIDVGRAGERAYVQRLLETMLEGFRDCRCRCHMADEDALDRASYPLAAPSQSEGWMLSVHPTVSWPVYLVSLCGWAGKKLRPGRWISGSAFCDAEFRFANLLAPAARAAGRCV
jgi:hypothetical protein